MMLEKMLTEEQQNVFHRIINFIYAPIQSKNDIAGIFQAPAGCGKSFLCKFLVEKLIGTFKIAGVAPTHKAKKVLDAFINKDRLIPIKMMTVSSMLSRTRKHSYIGTKHFGRDTDHKMNHYDLFLIDEASMITDEDVNVILNIAFQLRKKILFIGDKNQIPNPSQKYIIRDGIANKKDSAAFDLENKFVLTKIVRQTYDNPIIPLYTEIIQAIKTTKSTNLPTKTIINDEGKGVYFYDDKELWYSKLKSLIGTLPTEQLRVIAYTNEAIKNHNETIRKWYKRGEHPEEGELLMGYNNLGYPNVYLENGQDYIVSKIVDIKKSIGGFNNISGQEFHLKEASTNDTTKVFIPNLNTSENKSFLKNLITKAELVNKKNSSINAFKSYISIKNQIAFMDNIYKFNDQITSEREFRKNHPLLFKSITEFIKDVLPEDTGERELIDSVSAQEIMEKYGLDFFEERIQDDKPIIATEKLCDRFCVIEKDIDYGYAITAHKSQGSSFHTVFIDDNDFEKLQNYWSYKHDCIINSQKEKLQLKYVSYTRPTFCAHVFSN